MDLGLGMEGMRSGGWLAEEEIGSATATRMEEEKGGGVNLPPGKGRKEAKMKQKNPETEPKRAKRIQKATKSP